MNNFNFNLLKYFYYVAYYKGFTNASKQLNLAQSALSYNVRILEQEMNQTLIVRNKKTFELTEQGSELYETLKSVFGMLEENISLFQKQNIYQEITIGVRHNLSDFIFKDTIETYMKENHNIHLNINLYSKVDQNKFNEEYDILIDYEDYANIIETSNKKKLCTLENIFVAGDILYNLYKDKTSITEFEQAKFILMCPNKRKAKFNKMCFENNITPKSIISINDSKLSRKLIRNNIALSLVPKLSVIDELNKNEIKELKVKEPIFTDNVVIVYKKNNNTNVNKFIDLLIKKYNEEDN